jgi:hypothetical protein
MPGGEEGRHHVTSSSTQQPAASRPDGGHGRAGHGTRRGDAPAGNGRRKAGFDADGGHDVGRCRPVPRCAARVLLVRITPNPPVTLRDWLQILAGATLTAAMTTPAVRDPGGRASAQLRAEDGSGSTGGRFPRDVGLLSRRRRRGRRALPVRCRAPGLSTASLGCPAAVQLRVLAEAGDGRDRAELAIARALDRRRQPAAAPPRRLGASAAEPTTIVWKVATTDGRTPPSRTGGRSAARLWLASTAARSTRRPPREAPLAGCRRALAPGLAVPAGGAPDPPVPPVLRQLEEAGVAVCAPTAHHQVGQSPCRCCSGRDTAYPDAARILAVERA